MRAPSNVFTMLILGLVLLASAGSRAFAQSAQELFQRALAAERSAGKLPDAIALYQRVVREAGSNRALAARALVRLGAAYETLGRSEAHAAYDRVVREFGDQPDFVAQARARLNALEIAGQNGARRMSVAREVWSDVNVTGLNAVSPDARLIAFTDWGNGDLAVRDLQRNATRRLTNKGTWERSEEFAEVAVFSADGKRIAYSWFTKEGPYQLRTISIDGGAPRTIPLPVMYYVHVYDWTPDGAGILAAIEEKGGDAVLAIVGHDGSVRPLAEINSRWTSRASMSPDGRWVVFDAANGDEGRDIRIVASDASRPGLLVAHAANDWSPVWTPEGSAIAFLSDRTGTRALWSLAVTNGEASGPPRLVKADMGHNELIGFSRDGTMFYRMGLPSSSLMVADIALDSLRVQRPRSVATLYQGQNHMPDWSPDGGSLAYLSSRGPTGLPGERVLVTFDLASNRLREFSVPLMVALRPRWFADGRRIMLTGRTRGEKKGAKYSFDLETATLTRLSPPEVSAGQHATLSADERSILHVVYDSGSRASLRRVTIASGADELVYASEGRAGITAVAASPDNQWIAIVARENMGTPRAATRVRLLAHADGRVVRDLPIGQATSISSLNWSPDSRSLIAVGRMASSGQEVAALGSRVELLRLHIDGSPPLKFGFEAIYMNQLRLSRDGKRIAYVSTDSTDAVAAIWAIGQVLPAAARIPGSRPR